MSLYYQDDQVTLYHGDCREVMASLDARSVDCVITDPPYSDRTHKNARINAFASIDLATLAGVMAECGRVTRRWVVATMDYHHVFTYEDASGSGHLVRRRRMTTVASGEQVLPMPDIPGLVPGIVGLDPPALQCGDCGLIWAAESDRHGLALTVILSGCSGWGFCACTRAGKGPHVRRCGDCNKAHRATHPERWQ